MENEMIEQNKGLWIALALACLFVVAVLVSMLFALMGWWELILR